MNETNSILKEAQVKVLNDLSEFIATSIFDGDEPREQCEEFRLTMADIMLHGCFAVYMAYLFEQEPLNGWEPFKSDFVNTSNSLISVFGKGYGESTTDISEFSLSMFINSFISVAHKEEGGCE